MLAVLLSNKSRAHDSLGNYEVDEELFSIFKFREERIRCEVLLELLQSLFIAWSPLKVFRLACSAKEEVAFLTGASNEMGECSYSAGKALNIPDAYGRWDVHH